MLTRMTRMTRMAGSRVSGLNLIMPRVCLSTSRSSMLLSTRPSLLLSSSAVSVAVQASASASASASAASSVFPQPSRSFSDILDRIISTVLEKEEREHRKDQRKQLVAHQVKDFKWKPSRGHRRDAGVSEDSHLAMRGHVADTVDYRAMDARTRVKIPDSLRMVQPASIQMGIDKIVDEDDDFDAPDEPHVVTIAIMGAPNAGKSALVNTLLDNKISAVSPRVNTTREAVLGVLTEGDTQMILVDTPGIVANKNVHAYTRELVKTAWEASLKCDVALLLIDASKPLGRTEHELLRKFNRLIDDRDDIVVALVLNKVDAVSPKSKLLPLVELINNTVFFDETFMISAIDADGTDDVKEYLFSKAHAGEWEFNPYTTTDRSLLERVEEIVREQLFKHLGSEVPYFVSQRNTGWSEDKDSPRIVIDQLILVPRSSQVGMVVGHQGGVLHAISEQATIEIERIVRRPVLLRLRVKHDG